MATKSQKEYKLTRIQWDRYTTGMDRGHQEYQVQAKKCEDYYFGNGKQWDDEVKAALDAVGKPWLEENVIFPTVNTVLGYQTQSRMDIAYKPREAGDQDVADILTKLSMFIVDQNQFPWKESQVFGDGLIQQRGYFDVRMDFDKNINGDINISVLDPLDVIPDPDAKAYNPEEWQDVLVTKWMPLEDIRVLYGLGKYRKVLQHIQSSGEPDFGADDWGVERNKFAEGGTYSSFYKDNAGEEHVRVIERQWYKLTNRSFWYNVETGDLLPIPDTMKESESKKVAKANGYEILKRTVKRVRWTVSTYDCLLHDDWSPYEDFTVVPFFPYFRRGKTVGMVDNLIKTQEMLNKTYSQMLHVINTTANSGWKIEENSLVNMEVEDLEDVGGQTGLVLEYKAGRTPPEKIEPNQIPTGLKDMATTGVDLIRMISGVSETFQGGKGPEVSGTAIQSRVHQSAIQLATPIDNLFRTRNMIAQRVLNLIQQFYTEERTFTITQEDSEEGETEQLGINQENEFGEIINDVTVGKYDIVIADVPTQITFQNAQFQQALDMRKFGVEVPDDEMVLMSTLSRKNEIAKKMNGEGNAEQEQAMMEQMELQLEQLRKEVEKLDAEADHKQIEAAKKAAEIAELIVANPQVGVIMDSILAKADAKEMAAEAPVTPQEPQIAPNTLGGLNF